MTLDFNERQEEEEFQEQFPGVGIKTAKRLFERIIDFILRFINWTIWMTCNKFCVLQISRPAVHNVNRDRRGRFQHPKGVPDAELIFGGVRKNR